MKPFHYMLMACGLGVLACGPQARAQDATTNAQGTYGQLSDLISQIAILKAQLQVLQLKQQIAASARDMSDLSAPASGPVPSAQAGVLPPPPTPTLGRLQSGAPGASGTLELEPHILSIAGQGEQLSALLLMPGGGEVQVVPGTLLGDGSMVKAISPQSVRVIQRGTLVALPFAGSGEGGGAALMSGG